MFDNILPRNLTIKNQKKKDRDLINIENPTKDIELKKFTMENVIKNIESLVVDKEKRRNFKMQNDYDKEKNYILDQHKSIKDKIEDISRKNMNERYINIIKYSINIQQELYNRYYTLNEDLVTQINKIKVNIPELTEKIDRKYTKLKKINQENLILMEKLNNNNKTSNILNNKSHSFKNNNLAQTHKDANVIMKLSDTSGSFIEERLKNSSIVDNMDYPLAQNYNNKSHFSKFRYSEYGKEMFNYLNISEVLDDNANLKAKFDNIKNLKDTLSTIKNKERHSCFRLSELNTESFTLSKLFTDGMSEISKELLKIHELQLDKLISKNPSGNSLYFELVKERNPLNSNNEMKLPLINASINKKYNFPIVEKSDTPTFIYNVIKNMLNEHYALNKSLNLKKKKFQWDEFSNFSGYQIYTLLCLNKQAVKAVEHCIFPKKSNLNINPKELYEINEDFPLEYQ